MHHNKGPLYFIVAVIAGVALMVFLMMTSKASADPQEKKGWQLENDIYAGAPIGGRNGTQKRIC